MRPIILLSLFQLLFPSPSAMATPIQQAVTEYCDCMEPVLSKMKELHAVLESKEMEGLEELFKSLEALEPTLRKCSESLEKTYSDHEDQLTVVDKIQEEIDRRCPKPKRGSRP